MSEHQPENQPENALHIEAAPPKTQPGPRRALRIRTVVFGLILLVIAGCVLVAQLTSAHLDPGAVALGLMVAAGLLLIAGGRGLSR